MEHDDELNREEVLKDFKESIDKIDFTEYNPNSPEFNKAVNIGLMWLLLGEIIMNPFPEKEIPSETVTNENDDISEEIFGAKKYLQKFMDTGDSVFKEMSSDELKHAGILMKKANARLPSGEEKQRLKSYEGEIQEIQRQIESV